MGCTLISFSTLYDVQQSETQNLSIFSLFTFHLLTKHTLVLHSYPSTLLYYVICEGMHTEDTHNHI